MTVEDINKVAFERSVRGYKMQDVDDFLVQIAREFETLTMEKNTALAEKDAVMAEIANQHEASEKKLYILAEKIEQYRNDEETLKSALLNAQRLGESVVQEARQNAEKIVKEANAKATKIYEDLKILQSTEEKRLLLMRSDVSKFRADILNMYKHHIEQLNSIPGAEEKKAEPQAIVQETIAPVIAEEEKTSQKAQNLAEMPKSDEQPSDVGAMPSPVKVPENPLPTSSAPAENVQTQIENVEVASDGVEEITGENTLNEKVDECLPKQEEFEDYAGIKFD